MLLCLPGLTKMGSGSRSSSRWRVRRRTGRRVGEPPGWMREMAGGAPPCASGRATVPSLAELQGHSCGKETGVRLHPGFLGRGFSAAPLPGARAVIMSTLSSGSWVTVTSEQGDEALGSQRTPARVPGTLSPKEQADKDATHGPTGARVCRSGHVCQMGSGVRLRRAAAGPNPSRS